jgi:PAS domain S-box-containing protein
MADTDSPHTTHDVSRERLYDAVSAENSLTEKRRAVVELGTEYLGVNLGFVSAIDADSERFEVLVSTDDDLLEEGAVYDLSRTYCRRCVDSDSSLAVTDAVAEGWSGDPAYEEHGLGCYLGTPIHVDGELVGTVCFADTETRDGAFTSVERAFVELAARLLGREHEIARYERQLDERDSRLDERAIALEDSERKYEALMTTAPDAIFVAEADSGAIVDANEAAVDLAGVSVERLCEMNLQRFHDDEVPGRYWAEFQRFVAGDEETMSHYSDGTRLTIERPDGTVVPVEISARTVAIDGAEYVQGIVRDVSDRLQREEDIARQRRQREQTEQKYESLVTAAPNAIVLADLKTRELVEVNEAAVALTGYRREELLDRTVDAIHPTGTTEQYIQAVQDGLDDGAVTTGELPDGSPILVQRKDGSTVPIEISLTDVEVAGRPHALAIIRDVSDRRERERELRVKDRAVQEAPVGITISDPDTDDNDLVYANDRFEEMTGYDQTEVVGDNCRFLQGPGTDAEDLEPLRTAVENAQQARTEVLNYRKDGTPFWNEVSIAPVTDDSGEVTNFVGFQRDVTARKRQAKLVTVLNRVLRHNLRNGMNVVLARTAELQARVDAPEAELVAAIRDRAQQLVALGERANDMDNVVDADQSVTPTDAVEMVSSVAAELDTEYPDATVQVDAPQSQPVCATGAVEEALRELATNAVTHGGPEPTVEFAVERIDRGVLVRVSDDGPGLPQDEQTVLDRGYETPLEHASGLGLWFVNWVVTGVGGHVSATVDDGTTVTLTLREPGPDDESSPRRSAFLEQD